MLFLFDHRKLISQFKISDKIQSNQYLLSHIQKYLPQCYIQIKEEDPKVRLYAWNTYDKVFVRFFIVQPFGSKQMETHLPALQTASKEDPDEEVRRIAIEVVKKFILSVRKTGSLQGPDIRTPLQFFGCSVTNHLLGSALPIRCIHFVKAWMNPLFKS